MFEKAKVVEFFDRLAPTWDEEIKCDTNKINTILDYAKITKGQNVLDVACGTGVLFPFYLEREIKSVTGVDISPEMITRAKRKFTDFRISLICDDIENVAIDEKFDCCMVYNAFPHFGSPSVLIERLAALLCDGGRLTVAHGDSLAVIDGRHKNGASAVSIGLLPIDEMKKLFEPHFDVDVAVSDDKMYVMSGTRKG